MKKILLITAGFTWFVVISGCIRSGKSTGENIITERVEYPVFIKDPYNADDGHWWRENIETSKRMDFVKTLFDWAYSGKVKSYHYDTYRLLTPEEVKKIGFSADTVSVVVSYTPLIEKDTIIRQELDLNYIHKVKFAEEWSFDMDNHTLHKRVLGIAPMLTVYSDSNEIRGYKPLFWIYFDEEFAKKQSGSN